MATVRDRRLERRLIEAAEASLDQRGFVTAIDVLIGLGWLPPSGERAWRQGRIPYLERAVSANLSKVSGAMRHFRRWATTRGLKPSETAYVARTRDRRTLRFSKSGKPSIELAYRTHWARRSSPSASASGSPSARAADPTSWSSRRSASGHAVPAAGAGASLSWTSPGR